MKKLIALVLVLVCVLALSACKQEDILHLGINAEIVEIDTDNQIVYVVDCGEEQVLRAKCAIDCQELIENQEIIYVDYTTNEVSNIQFADLAVGDKITINAYESHLNCVADSIITVEQIQLATQRLDNP